MICSKTKIRRRPRFPNSCCPDAPTCVFTASQRRLLWAAAAIFAVAEVSSRGDIVCFTMAFVPSFISVRSKDRFTFSIFNQHHDRSGRARGDATISIDGSHREKALNIRYATTTSSNEQQLSKSKLSSKRMKQSNEYRSYCPRCHRPTPTCLCHALSAQRILLSSLNLRLLILQHPREARKRKRTSTVPLIGLCLDGVEICVGTSFGCEGGGDSNQKDGSDKRNCPEALRRVLEEPEKAILLYPGEGAVPLTERYPQFVGHEAKIVSEGVKSDTDDGTIDGLSIQDSPDITTFVVLDGTWAQTQSMMQSSPSLASLPQCMFDDDTDSLFDPLRREPAGHCTSTLEAVSRTLRVMGSSAELIIGKRSHDDNDLNSQLLCFDAAKALESSLEAMVEGQLRYAADATRARPRSKKNSCATEIDEGSLRDNQMEQAAGPQKVRRRRQAQLRLPRKLSETELEEQRIRFIYVAHLG